MFFFYRRLLIDLIGILSVNTLLMLLTNSSVKAEESNCNCRLTPVKNISSATKLPLKLPLSIEPAYLSTVQKDRQQLFAIDSGPTLRRNPLEGQPQFEPTRIPLVIPQQQPRYRTTPGISIINPSGYGASWGSAGLGVGFQERVRFRDKADGVFGVGFGLGNAAKNVGLQVGVSFVDVSNPWRDGGINLKLHRRLPKDFAVAIGVQGLATWGETDGGSSVYGVTTKRFALRED